MTSKKDWKKGGAIFLRGMKQIWDRFAPLTKGVIVHDEWGAPKEMTGNRGVERLMRVAIERDKLPLLMEIGDYSWLECPLWKKSRRGEAPRCPKIVNVRGLSIPVIQHFKALCARRGKTVTQGLAMLMVQAINKGKLPYLKEE